MKLLVVLSSFYLIVHARGLVPEITVKWGSLAHVIEECVKITNVDPEIPKTMFRHVHLPNESTFHCFMRYIFYIFHKQSMISSDDEMIIPIMLEEIPSLTPELAQYCVEETDSIHEQLIMTILVLNCYFAEVGRYF